MKTLLRKTRFASACVLAASAVWAEPYIAVRSGFKCSQCHVNVTGGGKRTEYGLVYSQFKLRMMAPGRDSLPYSFDPQLNRSVSVGANFRVHQVRTFDYRWNPTPAQVADGLDTVDLRSRDNAVVNEGNLYVQVDMVRNFFTLYLDQTMSPATANREAWAKINLPGRGYFKFGNMLLPYGYRLMDDAAYVRNETGYTYGTTGLGYEVGYEPGPLSAVVNMTPTRLSSVGSLVFSNLPVIRSVRVGGSYATALKKNERDLNHSQGAFGGFTMGMFTVLAERDYIRKDTVDKIADYAEVDFLPVRGFNLKFVYEYLRPDISLPAERNGVRRYVFGAEPFLIPFLQVGLYYRMHDGPPQLGPRNQDEIIGRLHAFF